MLSIESGDLPQQALLRGLQREGVYTDCYWCDVPRSVSQAEYVEAFYTSGVFRVERFLLAQFVGKPSTDLQAQQLGVGTRDSFAAWRVEARRADQLLLADFMGRTRSWLMTAPVSFAGQRGTRLYFGSSVNLPRPRRDASSLTLSIGAARWQLLLGFHRMYSRVLLVAVRWRLS